MDDIQMAARPVLVSVAQEDHIIAERDAAVVAAEFRPRPTEQARQRCYPLALGGQPVDEIFGNSVAAAFARDMGCDFSQGAPRRRTVDETSHVSGRMSVPRA